jgi:L-fuculose-phosphate aldolase
MVIVLDSELNAFKGDASLVSRESQLHFACYRHFPEVNGVVHAHPRYLSVFAAAGQPLPPASEYTEKYGTIEVIPPLPSHSAALADAVVERLSTRRETLARNGLGLILAYHGVATFGRDLSDAYDILDRLEWNAHTHLMRGRLPDPA